MLFEVKKKKLQPSVQSIQTPPLICKQSINYISQFGIGFML